MHTIHVLTSELRLSLTTADTKLLFLTHLTHTDITPCPSTLPQSSRSCSTALTSAMEQVCPALRVPAHRAHLQLLDVNSGARYVKISLLAPSRLPGRRGNLLVSSSGLRQRGTWMSLAHKWPNQQSFSYSAPPGSKWKMDRWLSTVICRNGNSAAMPNWECLIA